MGGETGTGAERPPGDPWAPTPLAEPISFNLADPASIAFED